MLFRLLALFIALPLIELWLLMLISDSIGWKYTLALVLLTGTIGAMLARHEGLRTWQAVHKKLNAGQVPSNELTDGLMILVAGALLVTPGVITDVVGFSLLTPQVRAVLRAYLAQRLKLQTSFTAGHPGPFTPDDHPSDYSTDTPRPEDDDIIDVEFEEREE